MKSFGRFHFLAFFPVDRSRREADRANEISMPQLRRRDFFPGSSREGDTYLIPLLSVQLAGGRLSNSDGRLLTFPVIGAGRHFGLSVFFLAGRCTLQRMVKFLPAPTNISKTPGG